MLKSISLKFTEAPTTLSVEADGVTVFVGPNNSGKSLLLREIETSLSSYTEVSTKLLNDFELNWPSQDQLSKDIEQLIQKTPSSTSPELLYIGRFNPAGELDGANIRRDSIISKFKEGTDKRWVASQFLKFFLIRLDGRTRFDLTSDRPMGDLLNRPLNFLAHLFQDDQLRAQVREIVFDAFGQYFVIDALSANVLRMRLSQTPPDGDEQNLNAAARIFHRAASHIRETSDGVQAFVGIICAVLSGDYRLVLVDEPEAFLHPPLARKLGYQLTSKLRAGDSLMTSTHSADFLMGCLQASSNVRIVRLEHSNGKSRGRIINSEVLSSFFKKPLIRSANVISALFHDGVVVTESENDRAFYAEIYHRLTEKEKGLPSLLFVHAQNKQTIKDIVGPLRSFGIPAAAITDIDILKDGGSTWNGWLDAAQIPETLRTGYGQIRGELYKRFQDTGKDMKTDGGVSALPSPEKAAADDLFDKLSEYGVFVVRNGELETWLPELQIKGKKTDWTVGILERLGADPTGSNYVRPSEGDVWSFIRSIACWAKNPSRKGLS